MRYFISYFIVLFGAQIIVSSGQTFTANFTSLIKNGFGSCGIYYENYRNRIALIPDKWFTSENKQNDPICTCSLQINYKDKNNTIAIRGASNFSKKDIVELSYAAFYLLDDTGIGVGYNAVFTFVDCVINSTPLSSLSSTLSNSPPSTTSTSTLSSTTTSDSSINLHNSFWLLLISLNYFYKS